MDKSALIERLRSQLRADLASAERSARETAAAANHPEARPENDKDTRKIELSYLAAGQAARARELEGAIAMLAALPARAFASNESVQVGALVRLEVDGKEQRVLVSTAGGGLKLEDGRSAIHIVTPQSPMGRGLIGKTVGDTFELNVAGRVRDVEVVGVE